MRDQLVQLTTNPGMFVVGLDAKCASMYRSIILFDRSVEL